MAQVGTGPPQLLDLLRTPHVLERILLLTGSSGPALCGTVGLTCRSMDEFVCGRPALWHRYELRLHVEPTVPYVSDTIDGPIVAKQQLRAVVRHLYVRFTRSKLPPVLFASTWPQLRTLRLSGCRAGCSMTYDDMEALIGSTPKLEELTLERCRIVDGQREASGWLLESCWRRLRTVALYDCAPEPARCVALQTGNLRSLHVRTGGWLPMPDVEEVVDLLFSGGYDCFECERERIYGRGTRAGRVPRYSAVGGGGEARQQGAMYRQTEEPSLADFVQRNAPSLCEFVAGLSGECVLDTRPLARCDRLRRLRVSADSQNARAAAGAQLEELMRSQSGLEELHLAGLPPAPMRSAFAAGQWPALRSLRLKAASTSVRTIVASAGGLRRLRALCVRLDDEVMRSIVEGLPHLTHLELYWNRLMQEAEEAEDGPDAWPALDAVPHERLKCIERIVVRTGPRGRSEEALRSALTAVGERSAGRVHARLIGDDADYCAAHQW